MPGIRFYRSNSLEHCADLFYKNVAEQPLPPLKSELVLVQSIGMGRWLSLELSQKAGIWGNCSYLYPNAFLETVFAAAGISYNRELLFSKDSMTWSVMEHLPSMHHNELFSHLSGYLQDRFALKRFQLSGKIADMYDQYITGRPEMITYWDSGEDCASDGQPLQENDQWQSVLWRQVRASKSGGVHRADIRRQFLEALPSAQGIAQLERISVFGASTLPQFHLDILQALSECICIDFYLMTPTYHYTGDLVSERIRVKTLRKKNMPLDGEQHYEEGNPLIASMGSLGRDFMNMLAFCYDADKTEDEDFLDPGDDTLLHSIQKDILELRDLPAVSSRRKIAETRRSVMIQSCHSPMREVEVLRDNLLDLFSESRMTGRPLEPRDVLVMATDIDLYAPFIDAVFRSPDDEPGAAGYIPYSIADRDIRTQSVLISVFLSLFSLNEKRFSFSAVADILSAPPLMRKFRLCEDDCETLRSWSAGAGIRWGVNAQDRVDAVGVSYEQNSFSHGMMRLLTGYLMHEEGCVADELLPADYTEGSAGDLLGRYAEIVRILSDLSRVMLAEHSIAEWVSCLLLLLDDLFSFDGNDADEFTMIRTALLDMQAAALSGGFTGKADYRIIREWLSGHLDETKHQFGFLNGRVTFCAMLPMRSIPFRVICMLGMDDGKFPRISRPLSFDLMPRSPRKGDRSQRNDDRYLFLESLLSARDCLYISYIGRSTKDNSLIPPSVLVSELLDYISAGYSVSDEPGGSDEKAMRAYCVTEHRLHSFSPAYFNGSSGLFSYSAPACRIAMQGKDSLLQQNLFSEALTSALSEEMLTIDPRILKSFFSNPARYLMRSRLGIRLFREEEGDIDNEPLDIGFFEGFEIENALVKASLAGESADPLRDAYLYGGSLPPAGYGRILYSSMEKSASAFAEKVRPFNGISRIRADSMHTTVCSDKHAVTLRGPLDGVTEKGILHYRGQIWKGDHTEVWIDHCLLNAVKPEGVSCETVFISHSGSYRLKPLVQKDAAAYLDMMLRQYYTGLFFPLSFYAKSSFAAAETYYSAEKKNAERDEEQKRDAALKAARTEWSGKSYGGGSCEKDNPYFRAAFRDADAAIDDAFLETSLCFFKGLFSCREDIK